MDAKSNVGEKACTVQEPRSSANNCDAKRNDTTGNNKPKGVSPAAWQRFKELQRKRQQLTSQNNDQSEDTETQEATNKGRSTENEGKDQRPELQESSTTVPCRKRMSDAESGQPEAKISRVSAQASSSSSEDWESVRQYIGVNDHLTIDRGKAAPKTELEKKIDTAISLGQFETAEKLSDQLATRDFGKNIADAFDAKRFLEKKQKEKEEKEAKKKQKLHWGFEHKNRWETKSNM